MNRLSSSENTRRARASSTAATAGRRTASPDANARRPVRRRRGGPVGGGQTVDLTTVRVATPVAPPPQLLPLLPTTKRARISASGASRQQQPSSTSASSSVLRPVPAASATPIQQPIMPMPMPMPVPMPMPMPTSAGTQGPPPSSWHIDDSASHVDLLEEVDLTEPSADDRLLAREQEELLKLQRPDGQEKPKLADFKCVICLDDPTDLAATPCGHMFCDFCLQGALRAGQAPNAKSGPCPVCRRKVNIREIIPLEMKLLTKSMGKGKGRAG